MKEVVCQSRTKRRDPGQSQLMPRELDALGFISQAQPIASKHYARFLGLSLPVARRSLRKLRNLGFINVHVTSVAAPNRFTLSQRGRKVLGQHLNTDLESLRFIKSLGRFNLPHHEGSVDLFVALHQATKLSSGLELGSFVFEHELRRQLASTRGALVPDAVAVFSAPGQNVERQLHLCTSDNYTCA